MNILHTEADPALVTAEKTVETPSSPGSAPTEQTPSIKVAELDESQLQFQMKKVRIHSRPLLEAIFNFQTQYKKNTGHYSTDLKEIFTVARLLNQKQHYIIGFPTKCENKQTTFDFIEKNWFQPQLLASIEKIKWTFRHDQRFNCPNSTDGWTLLLLGGFGKDDLWTLDQNNEIKQVGYPL